MLWFDVYTKENEVLVKQQDVNKLETIAARAAAAVAEAEAATVDTRDMSVVRERVTVLNAELEAAKGEYERKFVAFMAQQKQVGTLAAAIKDGAKKRGDHTKRVEAVRKEVRDTVRVNRLFHVCLFSYFDGYLEHIYLYIVTIDT